MLIRTGFFVGMLWLVTYSAVSQPTTSGRGIDDHLLIKESEKGLGEQSSSDVIGSPYLNETFAKGEVYFDKGNLTVVQQARYNIYSDWVEYQQNNQTLVLDPDQRIRKVRIEDHVLIVDKYPTRGKIKHGYFTLLDSGKLMLLSKHVVNYREPQAAGALESTSRPAKYTRAPDEFYYKLGSGDLKKIDNVKDLIADLPGNAEELKEFVKKEKISARKKEELLKFVQYYNTL